MLSGKVAGGVFEVAELPRRFSLCRNAVISVVEVVEQSVSETANLRLVDCIP